MKIRFRRYLRTGLAGSLMLGGALSAVTVDGAVPASAAPVVRTIHVSSSADGANSISSDGVHVWVVNSSDDSVTELDAVTGAVVKTITSGASGVFGMESPWAISSDGTDVWVTTIAYPATVNEIDVSNGAVVGNVVLGGLPAGISSDGTDVWVANQVGNAVSEIDASTRAVVRTITVGRSPEAISSDGTDVWVANSDDNTVSEINASTGVVVRTITVGRFPDAISSDGTDVWVTNFSDNTVSEIDASNGAVVQSIAVGDGPAAISSNGTYVWVANQSGNTATEIDASTGAVVQTIAVGAYPTGISWDGYNAWVANFNDNTVSEIALAVNPGFTITTSSLPAGTSGVAYGPVVLHEAGADRSTSPYATSFKWAKGKVVRPATALPRGIKLSSAGILSGTPNSHLSPGQYSVIVKVTEKVTTTFGKHKKVISTTATATIPITIN
jgi:YVTN family beta-propeller protein